MSEKQVLIVERSLHERQKLIQHLCITDPDLVVDGVGDFPDAVDAIKMLDIDGGYHAIVSDLGIVPLEGISFIKGVNLRFPDIPVILTTELQVLNKFQQELVDCQFFEIHCKPLNLQFFELTLKIALKNSKKS